MLVELLAELRGEIASSIDAELLSRLDATEVLAVRACASLYEELRMTKRQYELLHKILPKVFVSSTSSRSTGRRSTPS